jgi:hypothetical protein
MMAAAVPTIFPPVYIDVEIEGQHFDEMHVDGGPCLSWLFSLRVLIQKTF